MSRDLRRLAYLEEHFGGRIATRVSTPATLEEELRQILAPVRTSPYLVFHDAYHYFEARFGLNAVGSVAISPDRAPGIKRLRELRKTIRTLGVRCVFTEPQFPPRIIKTLTEGTDAHPATLDPLGASIEEGTELYFRLMRRNAGNLRQCLLDGDKR